MSQETITGTFTKAQAVILRALLESDLAAHKNWIAGAVESGMDEYGKSGMSGFAYAAQLVPKLREREQLFTYLNGSIMRLEGKL